MARVLFPRLTVAICAILWCAALTGSAALARAAVAPATPLAAPYVDMTLGSPEFDLAASSRSSGVKAYTLAFIVDGGGCRASWGGIDPVSGAPFAGRIAALRAAGGGVIASFGGQAGTELAAGCASVSALAAQYQSVINTYHLTSIDFDVEGAAATDRVSITRRSRAIAMLERHAAAKHRRLQVSLTVAVLPTGLDLDGLAVVRSAVASRARIDVVNLMAMDYGDQAAPHPAGRMAQYAIDAAQAVHHQLAKLYPRLGAARLWRMVGVTPMIGVNDTSDEIFGLGDAGRLLSFARGRHLGRLAFWAATRDHQCPGGPQPSAEDSCSSVTQANWAFSRVFRGFRG